jgi:hypothetical protein
LGVRLHPGQGGGAALVAQFQRRRQVALRGAAQVVHDVELRGSDVGGEHRFLRVAPLVGVEDGEGALADGVLLVWGRVRVVGNGAEGGLDDDGDEVAVEGGGGGFGGRRVGDERSLVWLWRT